MASHLLKSTTVVSFMTLVSRVVGFLRDMVLAHIFGAQGSFDAFLVAFKIPNFMRRLFAEGAFSQAFVPVLSEYRTQKTQVEVKNLVDHVFAGLSSVLFLVTILGMIAAPLFIRIFAPGFGQDDGRFALACNLLQITFPYILFISLVAFAGGIQNTYRKFSIPALTPVLLNVSLIFAAVYLSQYFKVPVVALAWGVMIAGVLQLLFQVPFLAKLSMWPTPRLIWWRDPGVKRILMLMVPAILGASVMQINLLVDTIFASFLPVGSLTWLYYSDRLLEFPIGVFGVALATVVLPHLSQEHARESHTGFSASVDWALRWILLIGVPATAGLILLAGPILASLFQYGKFLPKDVMMASKSLITLSMGLVFFLAVKILVSAFYAKQNTKLPVKIAIIAMILNIVFNALFIVPLAHAGLTLASTLSSVFNVLALLYMLLKQKIYVPMAGWKSFMLRIIFANAVLSAVLWWLTPSMDTWFEWQAFERLSMLMVLIVGAMVSYGISLWLSGLRYAHMRIESVG